MDETTETIFEHINTEMIEMRKNLNAVGRTLSKVIDDLQILQARMARIESAFTQPQVPPQPPR